MSHKISIERQMTYKENSRNLFSSSNLITFNSSAFIPLIAIFLMHLSGCTGPIEQEVGEVAESHAESSSPIDGKWDSTEETNTPLSCSMLPKGWSPNFVHKMNGDQQFEGWYYRISDPQRDESWVVITAYWRNKVGETRAFIELIQGSTGATFKRVFEGLELETFQAQEGEFELWIGDVLFSAEQVSGSFEDEEGSLVLIDLHFEACALWGAPEDERNRWTMGWVTELPGPPLKWHVHHLKGEARGRIAVERGEENVLDTSLERAPVHQEKNWGSAFPKRWVWMQSNVFTGRPDVAFAAAGGPVFGFDLSPEGYMMGLRLRDRFYNWRTQEGHSFKDVDLVLDVAQRRLTWGLTAESLRYRAVVKAVAPLDELIAIDVPGQEGLEFGAFEHLSADLTIDLYEREGLSWRWIDQVHSPLTAVEAGGEFAERLVEERAR